MSDNANGGGSRRLGTLGVHSLDHVHFSVPDLAEAARFYGAFGLEVREQDGVLGLYTAGNPHRWAAVSEGKRKELRHISFAAFEEDMPRFKSRLYRIGVSEVDPPKGFESNGVWFRDPDGVLLEVHAGEKTSPNKKPGLDMGVRLPGIANAPSRSRAPAVHPQRLAHILTFTRDVATTLNFYIGVVGLKLSDRSGDMIGFVHGAHGSDHHVLAFLKADAPGLHHLSWDTGSVQAIGLGAMQMAAKGYSSSWGLGRHVLGSNYFHYIRDPWNSWCEYACDIDYIPADVDWEAGEHQGEDSFYLWGPEPPKDFAVNYEA
jgi:catechol 2,3-dioxygenase